MARKRAADPRFDSRGGVNTTYSEDLLDSTEVRGAQNCRLTKYGSYLKRGGSRRVHVTQLPLHMPVLGVVQWDAPTGKEIVAISGGNLYHKLESAADFTEVVSTFSTTRKPRFSTHRVGAAIVLYIADGTALRSWDGTTLTNLTTTPASSAPAARDIAHYKGRLFATDGTKRLYGSKVSDPTKWLVADTGVFADVETYDTEGLTGIRVSGSSLLLCKDDTIARWTGVDQNNIRIDTETEGVSEDLGLIATGTLVELEKIVIGLSDRGVWIANEASADLDVSKKIEKEFLTANLAELPNAVAVHHRRKKEAWIAIAAAGETQNLTLWVYAYGTGAWAGPWRDMPACTLAEYERPDGTQSVIRGTYDGWILEEDLPDGPCLRDQNRDGTGGVAIGWVIDYGQMTFGDPTRQKTLTEQQSVEADLGATGVLEMAWESELGSGEVLLGSSGPGVRDYGFKWSTCKGRRIRIVARENSNELTEFVGLVPDAALEGRHGAAGVALVGADAATVGLIRADGSADANSTVNGSARRP